MNWLALETLIQNGVKHKLYPGASFAWVKKTGEMKFHSVGNLRYDLSSSIVTSQTLYDCASLTKTCPTAYLALIAIQKNMITSESLVRDILPDFQPKEEISVFHLLTHTLDFKISMSGLKNETPENIWKKLCEFKFRNKPGTSYLYCNATSIVLGRYLEKLYQSDLALLAQNLIFKPLNMKNTTFKPKKIDQVAPSEKCSWRKKDVCGEVHDESAFALRHSFVAGSAGLFSNTQDWAIFLRSYLTNQDLQKNQIFSAKLFEKTKTNQIVGLEQGASLGWEQNNQAFMGNCAVNSIGKTGFTGCHLQINWKKEEGLVFLSNSTWPNRNPGCLSNIRKEIANTLWGFY